jgi:hypothetical protein
MREKPIHRWFYYKEAFAPELPGVLLSRLKLRRCPIVCDPFAGVATTALSLATDGRVDHVIGVEYSPFAHFVGLTKLAWRTVNAKSLSQRLNHYWHISEDAALATPDLSAFKNPDIFTPHNIRLLLAAHHKIQEDSDLSSTERDFLTLGLAAVIEDASLAMRDGRALRILRGRSRRWTSLQDRGRRTSVDVRLLLRNQWRAMLDDITTMRARVMQSHIAQAAHVRGDARTFDALPSVSGTTADLSLFSPPYLNFIDYSEVYKLELWLLGFVKSQREFRDLRLGTLRNHPSVTFASRPYFEGVVAPTVEAVDALGSFVAEHHPRKETGLIIRQYFEDMFEVLRVQRRLLRPGAHLACVVANSTLARRVRRDGVLTDVWRLGIPTDVLIARLAEIAGFANVRIEVVRELRPRNGKRLAARESIVVAEAQ